MQDENKNIPDFLKNTTSQASNFPEEEKEAIGVSPLRMPFILISIFWFVLVLVYIHFFLGWSSLSALLPSEFITFLAGTFLSLAAILWLTAWIFRISATVNQSAQTEKLVNRVLDSKNNGLIAGMITQALQKQIQELTAAASQMSRQTVILKQTLETKAEDFSKISDVLNECFSTNLNKLNDSSAQLVAQCQTAAETAEKSISQFSAQSEFLRNDAKALVDELNPIINETIATAEHLKNITQESKTQISQINGDMAQFTDSNKKYLSGLADMLHDNNSRLEKTLLQTADNCEEIYKKLDTGISHIENSLKTHKELAAEQSALLDKNSAYLDGKLGEYGRLISLEVEAMIERSSTLDMNVKNQLNILTAARENIDRILNGANSSLEQKSAKAIKNIEKIIEGLDGELSKLNDFIKKTENKNSEVQAAAEKITRKIGDISSDLGQKVDDLKTRAVEAIDKFNEVSGVVQKNTSQLSETANIIVTKGREGAESLKEQKDDILLAVEALEDVKTRIAEIRQALKTTSGDAGKVFEAYKSQIGDFGSLINHQVELLNESQTYSEQQFYALKRRYEELSIDNFIDESAALIQSLENISVDINRLFNKDDDDDLWKKFYGGDHAVFARHVVKNLNRKQIVKIREEYEKDEKFRQLTDRYIREFESLLEAARGSERPEMLLSIFSNADVGKIYYVLARALDRLN